jgi:alkylated DNA repair dioxygenase AlkB
MMPLDPAVMTPNLFEETSCDLPLADGAVLLGGFARSVEVLLLEAIETVVAKAPFRHMLTPGGYHGRHDQLWRSRLGHRPQGISLCPDRS